MVSPVFIGRQEEMAILTAMLSQAADGVPAVALIGGEAGVGKTRLVSELSDAHICYNASKLEVNCGAYNDYAFGSVRHLNEPVTAAGNGNWTMEVTDMLQNDKAGRFVSWSITFFGRP